MIDRLPELLEITGVSYKSSTGDNPAEAGNAAPLDSILLLNCSTNGRPIKQISPSSYNSLTSSISNSISETYRTSISSLMALRDPPQFMSFVSSTLNIISRLKPKEDDTQEAEHERNVKNMLMGQIKGVSEIYNRSMEDTNGIFKREERRVREIDLLGVDELSKEEAEEAKELDDFFNERGGDGDLLDFGNGGDQDDDDDNDDDDDGDGVVLHRSVSISSSPTPKPKPEPKPDRSSERANPESEVLELEGSLLLNNLQSTLDAAESLETKMSTITQLLTSFTDIVQQQSEQIQGIERDAITAVDSVEKGGGELEKARERGERGSYWMPMVIAGLGVVLLLFNQMIP
ncbi:hypothetical protein TrST_g6822 [Triparma strigata]|uniref:t-SNARE coiled-coil homology domain-containing protein n=1 Tax=Triparma strigata TaxID=1606541 RepID=A0A9W7ALZ3_9STRA|nr:hypothetical protein TrST_g6822 [Triparma strigata]